jgi:hypothetical protein
MESTVVFYLIFSWRKQKILLKGSAKNSLLGLFEIGVPAPGRAAGGI